MPASQAMEYEPVPMLAREWAGRADSMTGQRKFAAVFAEALTQSAQRAAGLDAGGPDFARIEDIAADAASHDAAAGHGHLAGGRPAPAITTARWHRPRRRDQHRWD